MEKFCPFNPGPMNDSDSGKSSYMDWMNEPHSSEIQILHADFYNGSVYSYSLQTLMTISMMTYLMTVLAIL